VHVVRGPACGGPVFASLGSRNVRHDCEDHRMHVITTKLQAPWILTG
jgi:hypothetical protein